MFGRDRKKSGKHSRQVRTHRLAFETLERRELLSSSNVIPLPASPAGLVAVAPAVAAEVADGDITSLPYWRFKELTPVQVPLLTTLQVSTIPSPYYLDGMSADQRAAFTLLQVRALNPNALGAEDLTPTQLSWLTTSQIQGLGYANFSYLLSSQIPVLTTAQIASIPSVGYFSQWSAASSAALTQAQVQALDVGSVRIDKLTPTQVSWLTTSQIQSLDFFEFKYLSASQTPSLTGAQLATIPDANQFSQWSAAARAVLTTSQVQSLNVADTGINLLTPGQVAALTVNQIQSLDAGVTDVSLLTPTQLSWLTTSQIQSLKAYQFPVLNSVQVPLLTPAQIATIPSIASLTLWSPAARAALTIPQVQSLDVASVRIDLLTPTQNSWLTTAQIRALDLYEFKYLSPSQIPLLTPAQLATIPDPGTFVQWSPESRAALTTPQIQALNVAGIHINLLTPAQIVALTTAQVQSLSLYDFQYLAPLQIPLLTTAQIASIPDPGTFQPWAEEARAALTQPQIQALRVSTVGLNLLTTQQIAWLATVQVQSLTCLDFIYLAPSQIPLLTTAQMASLPTNYPVRTWSDPQVASLTRDQILAMPYQVYGNMISLQADLQPQYSAADHSHAPNTSGQILSLVPIASATHVTVTSGNWNDPQIWSNGQVPGAGAKVVIAAGTTVTFNAYMNAAMGTLRIDGTLNFATNINTQLKADTVVVSQTGRLHIGTAAAPIADNVTARILIVDNGPINTVWDPYLWSRGVVSLGEVIAYGSVVTPYVNLSVDPRAGDTTLYLSQAPAGWHVGDEIVIGGTNQYATDFGSDRVQIRAINGAVVTVDPLKYTHDAPDGQGISIQVANLNRNIQFQADNSSVIAERPHMAFVGNPDVDLERIGVYGFGRTDKSKPVTDPVVVNGVLQPGTGDNPRARYAIHFHHTGVDSSIPPAIVRGSVVVDSPGWGYVNHQSNVVMENNVAFDVVGASFVTEDGNEIGAMRNNLAMNTLGVPGAEAYENILSREMIHDFGFLGNGFWFQGPGVEVTNNISVGSRDSAFAYITESSRALFDAKNLADPTLAAGHTYVPLGTVPLKGFDNNTAVASKSGLEIWHHMNFMTDSETYIRNFTSWNNRFSGIDLHYVGQMSIINPKLIGNQYYYGYGIETNRLTHDITIVNPQIDGFETGIAMPVLRNSMVTGGNINAVKGIYIEKGHDTIRNATITGLTVTSPTIAELDGRQHYDVYATANFSFEFPNFLDRKVDSLFSQDSILVSVNGSRLGQVYFYEQSPRYLPFQYSTSHSYVPDGYLSKNNKQLAIQFGVSLGGRLLPSNTVQLPDFYGLIQYQ